jgi:hypothetical protein
MYVMMITMMNIDAYSPPLSLLCSSGVKVSQVRLHSPEHLVLVVDGASVVIPDSPWEIQKRCGKK